jgi:response regulator RpfG family c-di-GMP phosphodiesterase
MSAPSHNAIRSTVLLVDDDANVTSALVRHFPKQDYEVFTVTSAVAAYELLSKHPIDVIISDERMPGECGTQFLSKVRRLYPSAIRMVLSGQASMDAAIRAINEAEAYRFFLKPCNPPDLLVAVKQALDERRLRRQGLAVMKELQATVASRIDRPQPSYKLRIGDRVVRASAPSEGPGTITQVLAHGIVRVLWDFSVPSSMHTCDTLSLLTDTSREHTL